MKSRAVVGEFPRSPHHFIRTDPRFSQIVFVTGEALRVDIKAPDQAVLDLKNMASNIHANDCSVTRYRNTNGSIWSRTILSMGPAALLAVWRIAKHVLISAK